MLETVSAHPNLRVTSHPLIRHKLAVLRDRRTPKALFRQLVEETTVLMTYPVLQTLPEEEVMVETPLEATPASRVQEECLAVVPILRAGLGMMEGVLRVVPGAAVGHLGFYRDEETLDPVSYYKKLPSQPEKMEFILVDPMLATAGTASAAVACLKEAGAKRIRFLCLVVAPEGVARLERDHPDTPVYAAALDRQLNEVGYILPGLGDAGDRLFGTQ